MSLPAIAKPSRRRSLSDVPPMTQASGPASIIQSGSVGALLDPLAAAAAARGGAKQERKREKREKRHSLSEFETAGTEGKGDLFRRVVGEVMDSQSSKKRDLRDVVCAAMKLKSRAQALIGGLEKLLEAYDPMYTFPPPPEATYLTHADAATREQWFRRFAEHARGRVLEAVRSRAVTEECLRTDGHAAALTRLAAEHVLGAGRACLFVDAGGDLRLVADASVAKRDRRPSYQEVDAKGRERRRSRENSRDFEDVAAAGAARDVAAAPRGSGERSRAKSSSRDLDESGGGPPPQDPLLDAMRRVAAQAVALQATVTEAGCVCVPVVDDHFGSGALCLHRVGKPLDATDAGAMGRVMGVVDGIRAVAATCGAWDARAEYAPPAGGGRASRPSSAAGARRGSAAAPALATIAGSPDVDRRVIARA